MPLLYLWGHLVNMFGQKEVALLGGVTLVEEICPWLRKCVPVRWGIDVSVLKLCPVWKERPLLAACRSQPPPQGMPLDQDVESLLAPPIPFLPALTLHFFLNL